ncbi:MAG: UDP-N-acetylmuramoyl-L-alanine--D-glutamate ligase [Bryobacteraceae bacterium]
MRAFLPQQADRRDSRPGDPDNNNDCGPGLRPARRSETCATVVVVVGLARSGVAAIRLLREKGAQVRAVDEKLTGEIEGIPIEPQTAASLRDADLVVISPGVPADLPELDGLPVIGELELASFYLQGDTIGITGSNGKTTTTALAGHILRESGIPCQVGGNIGTPPTALVNTSRAGQWNVLELSSFQLETIQKFHARIAMALNVTPDHLDRHHTFEKYGAAKARLFETQQPGDYAILNADDPTCVTYAALTPATVVWFSSLCPVLEGLWLDGETIRFDGQPLMNTHEIPLRGRHNVENTMAAAAATHLAGATLPQIAAAVRTFPGVEHRLELVRELGGVAYYNDSKATNVDATLKALDAFPGGLWVILGGKDKNSDYTLLRDSLHEKARAALLIGAAAAKIKAQIQGSTPAIESGTLQSAVETAWQRAQPGEVVLLAPACASFDQFDNFEHRGRVFKAIVSQLAERGGAKATDEHG